MQPSPDSDPPALDVALARCCAALAACGAGQREALFEAREALHEFARTLQGATARFQPLCEALQRMMGHLLRRNALGESEALELGCAVMGFVRSQIGCERGDEPEAAARSVRRLSARPATPLGPLPAPGSRRSAARVPHPPSFQAPAFQRPKPQVSSVPSKPSVPSVPSVKPPPDLTREPFSTPAEPAPSAEKSALCYVNESRVGEILRQMGWISDEQLDRALVLQRVAKRRLGEVLVVMQAITAEQLQEALNRQRSITLDLASGGKGSLLQNFDTRRHA